MNGCRRHQLVEQFHPLRRYGGAHRKASHPHGFFVSRFRGDRAITDQQTGAPAFAIPLRTSESWRPSVAG